MGRGTDYIIMPIEPTLEPGAIDAIVDGRHGDPFSVLGPHRHGDNWVLRAFIPGAESAKAISATSGKTILKLERIHDAGLFESVTKREPRRYRLWARRGDDTWAIDDPYRFGPVLGVEDEYFLAEGSHLRLWERMGAHPSSQDGQDGVSFAVWAPNASRVSVVGPFNDWDGRRHVMRKRGSSGVWEIFIPGLGEGTVYKYEIRAQDGTVLPLKADPVGFGSEHAPANASIVRDLSGYEWGDADWMVRRAEKQRRDRPVSIYEVHLPSWRRRHAEDNRMLSYHELADELVAYVKDMGFTHIQMMPISEYPFDGSWGYQPVGLYAPTIRHGTPNELRDFVQACHQADIGLIADWVPGHFPVDDHGLGKFDGTSLYEHADPKEGFHQDWNTLIYNYGRREVQNFLVANALYWVKEYHLDGLRVDAVASMLYRDYSRKSGEWVPNIHGGRENLEAIAFLQRMNAVVYGDDDTAMTVAEESTAFPGVTNPVHAGGLGFGYKWNMGWMNDTLEYMKTDPLYRRHDHHKMTFGLTYAFSENYVLPLSHDEVVHGKGSLLGRMPGNDWERFANLRAYFAFMWAHPGKKLIFMGGEFAQETEWDFESELAWGALMDPKHAGMQKLIRDLNNVYRGTPALYQRDHSQDGFQWLDLHADDHSVYSWIRWGEDGTKPVVCIFNMTPVPRDEWRLGVPVSGFWKERINTDAESYGGSGAGNMGGKQSEEITAHDQSRSIKISLPPLSGLIFELD